MWLTGLKIQSFTSSMLILECFINPRKNQKKQFVNWGQSFRNPGRWEVLDQSNELGKMKPVNEANTSEPFKRAFSNHVLCNQIFKLFTSMRNRRPLYCINCINIGVYKVELIENKDLYLLSGGNTKQLVFITKEKLVKLS